MSGLNITLFTISKLHPSNIIISSLNSISLSLFLNGGGVGADVVVGTDVVGADVVGADVVVVADAVVVGCSLLFL